MSQQIKRATLTIGHGVEDKWKNVRILMWGNGQKLLAIMHAKRSTVIKDRKAGKIELLLQDVDYESFKEKGLRDGPKTDLYHLKSGRPHLSFLLRHLGRSKI